MLKTGRHNSNKRAHLPVLVEGGGGDLGIFFKDSCKISLKVK